MSGASYIRGYLLKITEKCNLNCPSCPLKHQKNITTEEIIHKLSNYKNGTQILLCGGEIFIRKDIFSILEIAKRLNLFPGIITNGRIFVYNHIIDKLLSYTNTVILTPFLTNDNTYKNLTGCKEGFKQSIEGLRQILRYKEMNIELRYPLNSTTVRHINSILYFLKTIGKSNKIYIVFSLFKEFRKDINQNLIIKTLLKSQDMFRESGKYYKIYFEDFPYCLPVNVSHISSNRFVIAEENNALCQFIQSQESYKKILACSECIYNNGCKGIPSGIYTGDIEKYIKPEKGVRSNSFDYIQIKSGIKINEPCKNCRIYITDALKNPERYLYLRQKNNISLYYTDTESFSQEEIRETKIIRQQLYIDTSKKTALDDFQKDIKILKLNNWCDRCNYLSKCAAFFTISDDIPFEREERWLKQEIKRLTGKVLDVGCGDMRFYKNIVNDLIQKNKIKYFGIDINQKALLQLKKDIPGALTIKTTIEEFRYESGFFDYIFMLRSINHFYDMNKAFENIISLLKNYGMII
ncbi:MAG: radical SAM protein, partial [Deltaproteobacteria bacterium]|nr:radical SAM protein [Deltaproteobacteria bacterium]